MKVFFFLSVKIRRYKFVLLAQINGIPEREILDKVKSPSHPALNLAFPI